MDVGLVTGAYPLTPSVDTMTGRAFVWARLTKAYSRGDFASVWYDWHNERVGWGVGDPFGGAVFDMAGVVLQSGKKDDFVPVAIYGPVDGVKLPGGMAATPTNNAVCRGGSRTNKTAGYSPLPDTTNTAVANFTDGITGSVQTGRSLFMHGRDYMIGTVFRSVGPAAQLDGLITQSLAYTPQGEFYMEVDASDGLVKDRLTLLRRGRGKGTWKATYNTSPNLGTPVTDGVFVFGVPPRTVAAKAGARGLVQVAGRYKGCNMGASVNVAQAGNGIRHTANSVTLASVTDIRDRLAFCAALASGSSQTRDIDLFGRLFVG